MRDFLLLPLAAFSFMLILSQTGLSAAELETTGTLNLVNQTGFNRFNVAISASVASGNQNTNATGTLKVRLKADPATGRVSSLTFEQGRVFFSNMNFTLRAFSIITVATATAQGLEGFATTPAPPAPVNPANGQFDAALHQFTLDKGSVNGVTTSALIPDVPVGTTFAADFAANPVSGTGEGNGTITLTEVPAQATPATTTWRTTVELPLNVLQNTDLEGVAVTIRMTGTLKAESNLTLPRNAYFAWTLANGLGAPAFETEIRPGEPLGLLWTMGLTPGASLAPYRPRPALVAGLPQAILLLPAAGTAAPLTVEISNHLGTGSWIPAPGTSLSGGVNPLPAGTKGTLTIPLTSAYPFLRLRANSP